MSELFPHLVQKRVQRLCLGLRKICTIVALSVQTLMEVTKNNAAIMANSLSFASPFVARIQGNSVC